MASEKLLHSRLLKDDSNRVIFHIDNHIGAVISGHLPDGRNILHRAKQEAESYRANYGIPIPGRVLVERVAMYIHAHTLYMSYRPMGAGVIISACDDFDKTKGTGDFSLYMIDPSGTFYVVIGLTTGLLRLHGRQGSPGDQGRAGEAQVR